MSQAQINAMKRFRDWFAEHRTADMKRAQAKVDAARKASAEREEAGLPPPADVADVYECHHCRGTGEGQFEQQVCMYCKGRGH